MYRHSIAIWRRQLCPTSRGSGAQQRPTFLHLCSYRKLGLYVFLNCLSDLDQICTDIFTLVPDLLSTYQIIHGQSENTLGNFVDLTLFLMPGCTSREKSKYLRTQEHPDAITPQGPRSTRTPSHHKDPGAPRRHHTTRTQEHPDTFTTQATRWDPGTPDAIGLGGPRCNQTILDQENPEVPQTSLDQEIPEAPIIL
ncbi:hypothetical protein STEG23_032825 [Scotinomys teguina]